MNKILFSVVAIARNEAKTLPRLLASLDNFKAQGGEVVIVDTGSTDNTASIAREWGCIVFEEGARFVKVLDANICARINEKFVVDGEWVLDSQNTEREPNTFGTFDSIIKL